MTADAFGMLDGASPLDLASRLVERARALGADEVQASVSTGSHVTLTRRERKIEQASEATTRGVVLSVLVDDRYTSNATSDLRPEALEQFLVRCIESSRYLEPDPFRRLPDAALCGRGVSEEVLDQDDPAWDGRTAADRAAQAEELETILLNLDARSVSCAASVSDGRSEAARVLSNGFAGESRGAWFSVGAEITLGDGERRPESSAAYSTRHLSDLPSCERIAREAHTSVSQRIGSAPIASGSYPMVVENKVAGRILALLGGPLSGASVHDGRSCLADRRGTAIGSELLTIVDDPTMPRGLGSRPWDGDCMVARPRTVVQNGVLEDFYVSLYYARRLGREPTTGGKSNWVVTPGQRSFEAIAADYDRCIQVTGFLGGNSNSTTGDFSYGIRGLLLEKGEIVQSLSEMNVTGNVLKILHQLVEVGNDPWVYGATRAPCMAFTDVRFSGS